MKVCAVETIIHAPHKSSNAPKRKNYKFSDRPLPDVRRASEGDFYSSTLPRCVGLFASETSLARGPFGLNPPQALAWLVPCLSTRVMPARRTGVEGIFHRIQTHKIFKL